MRHSFLAILISCLGAVSAYSQQPPAPVPPNASAPAKSAADATAPAKSHDYAQEAFVIEQMHSTYRFEADGTGRKETVARIRIQSEAGVQQWGQLQEGYNSGSERVEIPYVRVVKEDGTFVKAGDDAVQDLSAPIQREAPVYTDYRQKHITVPGLRPGEVLEYDMVTVIHTPLAAGQSRSDYEFHDTNMELEDTVDLDVPARPPVKLRCKP